MTHSTALGSSLAWDSFTFHQKLRDAHKTNSWNLLTAMFGFTRLFTKWLDKVKWNNVLCLMRFIPYFPATWSRCMTKTLGCFWKRSSVDTERWPLFFFYISIFLWRKSFAVNKSCVPLSSPPKTLFTTSCATRIMLLIDKKVVHRRQ